MSLARLVITGGRYPQDKLEVALKAALKVIGTEDPHRCESAYWHLEAAGLRGVPFKEDDVRLCGIWDAAQEAAAEILGVPGALPLGVDFNEPF